MNLNAKLLARSVPTSLLLASVSLLAVACGAPATTEELALVPQDDDAIIENGGDRTAAAPGGARRGIVCMGAMIPGVDDPEEHIKLCGGGGGGTVTPKPKPSLPSCSTLTADQLANPDVRRLEVPCGWNHKGVSSKDATFLQARARENCESSLVAAYEAATKEANSSVLCADETGFTIDGTDTDKSPFGARKFKAWGSLTRVAYVAGPFVPCSSPNPPPYCDLGAFPFTIAASWSE